MGRCRWKVVTIHKASRLALEVLNDLDRRSGDPLYLCHLCQRDHPSWAHCRWPDLLLHRTPSKGDGEVALKGKERWAFREAKGVLEVAIRTKWKMHCSPVVQATEDGKNGRGCRKNAHPAPPHRQPRGNPPPQRHRVTGASPPKSGKGGAPSAEVERRRATFPRSFLWF